MEGLAIRHGTSEKKKMRTQILLSKRKKEHANGKEKKKK